MGPQKEENQNEILEMEECMKPPSLNDEESNSSEETDESESMLLSHLKLTTDQQTDNQEEEEGFWLITFQVFFPFLIAGLGMVGAGLVLDIVQVSEANVCSSQDTYKIQTFLLPLQPKFMIFVIYHSIGMFFELLVSSSFWFRLCWGLKATWK